jgi:hypothetical protein
MLQHSPCLAAESQQLPSIIWGIKSAALAVLFLLLLSGCQAIGEKPVDINSPPEAPATEPDPVMASEASECQCPPPEATQSCDNAIPPPAVAPQLSCPPPVILNATQARTMADMLVIGRVENVYLPDKLKTKARIDTGAELTSLQALEIVEFERDGKPWVRFKVENGDKQNVVYEQRVKRFISIKQAEGEPLRRPVVAMSIALGELEERVEVTLMDRSAMVYDVVIGRNFLRDRAVVDVSKKFTASSPTD